jgi:hypothetical protein
MMKRKLFFGILGLLVGLTPGLVLAVHDGHKPTIPGRSLENLGVNPYFQQRADYEIEVELDPQNHLLRARMEMFYENRSPDTLFYIYMHLWPNAYRNNRTAFARQKAASGSWDFYAAPDSLRGGIDSLDFRTAGKALRWSLLPDTIDVAIVWLDKPLLPGARVSITTPFRVQIPGNFSRLGRDRGQYQLCQWYPKPAVYDRDGWHPMPYLDLGEFYSEFGNFDVQITVPAHFRVAGSGELQTASEQAWLDSLSTACWALDSFPRIQNNTDQAGAQRRKTVQYRLENAHDFAWFCGPDYYVRQSKVRLPHSGRTVKTAVFFTRSSKLWKDAAAYVDSSVYYYSLWVGDYPWSTCTAVDGALSAGGGMEYPTITVIAGVNSARILELVIAHEVGHNWFYGILASNERDHPFMDEGFNSYYESRYMRQRFAYDANPLGLGSGKLVERLGLSNVDGDQLTWLLSCRRGREAPLWSSASTDYDSETYGTLVYKKTALELNYLDAYVGRERFDQMMQAYYEEWKFRHPSPSDMKTALQSALQRAGGGRATEWWFTERLQGQRGVDYRLGRVVARKEQNGNESPENGPATFRYRVRVKGMGSKTPFLLAALDERGEVMRQEWYEPISGRQTFDISLNERASSFTLDPNLRMPLAFRERSHAEVGVLFPALPGLRLMPGLDAARNRLWLLPVLGSNQADGAIIGLSMMTPPVFPRNFEYTFMPALGVKSRSVVGQVSVRQMLRPSTGIFSEYQLRGDLSRYTNYQFGMGLSPDIRWEISAHLKLREGRLSVRRIRQLSVGVLGSPWRTPFPVHTMDLLPQAHNPRLIMGFLGYKAEHPGLVHSVRWQADVEWGALNGLYSARGFTEKGGVNARLSASVSHKWYYKTRGNRAYLAHRWFAGLAQVSDPFNPIGFLGHGSGITGWLDYGCREIFYGRHTIDHQSGPMPLNLRQVSSRDAGLRSVMNPVFVDALQNTRSATQLLATNWVVTIPRFPLEIYAGLAHTGSLDSVQVGTDDAWRPILVNYRGYMGELGLSLSVFNGLIRLNGQLAATEELRPGFLSHGRSLKWYEYFSWSIDLRRLNPHDLVRNFRM